MIKNKGKFKNIYKLRYWIIPVLLILFYATAIHAQGLSGHVNLIHNFSETREDGEKTTDSTKLSHNGTFDFSKSVTNAISYRLYLRENFSEGETADSGGGTTKTYKKEVEPSVDIFLRNPMYNFSTGYRRDEEWSTAHLTNEGRRTSVFYYARTDVTPGDFPSLSLDFDRKEEFDYLDPQTLEKSSDDYSASSAYNLPSEDVTFRYYLNYSHNVTKDEVSITEKKISDDFTTNYNTGYSGFIWNRKINYTVGYKGNYSRNKERQFVSQIGSLLNERTQLGGFYTQNINSQLALNPLASLADNNVTNSAGINLNTGTDHQIGISVSSGEDVDRLYIYVDRNISIESNLNSSGNWNIFSSNFNALNTWQPVSISSVTITNDTSNNIFRYEIEFTSPQNASFFKAINTATSNVLNVQVTEIEAYGTDQLPTIEIKNVNTSFIQGIAFQSGIHPDENLSMTFNYSLDRSDQNPVSISKSFGGVFQNMFSDSISGEKNNFTSRVTRNYGITSSLRTYTLLTTTLSFQKNENFDNLDQSDFVADTYRVAFNSTPLPTLDSNLTLTRNESFSFGEKDSITDSVILSTAARLYTDLNMITDIGYTKAKSLTSEITTRSQIVNVSLDARFTKRTSGTLSYVFNRQISESEAPEFHGSVFILNYRPGRFINITGTFRYSDSDGIITVYEGISTDWLPLPAVRFNFSYNHNDSEPDPSRSDSLNGILIWYLTKFADLRFTFTYAQSIEETKRESYNYNTSLNCRF
jgi:hypothetical protein